MVAKLDDALFRFMGRVVWLTAEQDGRRTGPPRCDSTNDYAANAYVPPHTFSSGGASFVLRTFVNGALVSRAEGAWLALPNSGPQRIQPGTVVVITEGPKPVGYFHVDEVPHE